MRNDLVTQVEQSWRWSPVSFLRIMRPKQWMKNVFVFAAVVFAGEVTHISADLKTLLAFITFCLVSGAVYTLNDIVDAKKDAIHPTKRQRPIPSGQLTVPWAVAWLTTLVVVSIGLAAILGWPMILVIGVYFIANVAYSLYFKHEFLLDALFVSIGFVLRSISGAVAIHVRVSPWLFVCTVLLSLFLVFGKRQGELIRLGPQASIYRKVFEFYDEAILAQFLSIITSASIVSYALYSFFAASNHMMMLTLPFVVYGLFRYLYLIRKSPVADAPEEALLSDIPSLVNILVWFICTLVILYFHLPQGF